MSMIPFLVLGAAHKGGGSAMGEEIGMAIAAPIAAAFMGAEKIGEGFQAIKNGIVQRAQLRANKKEFEEVKQSYVDLSKGKEGTVEVFKNEADNSITTIIHTENGPFTRIEKSGEVVTGPNGTAVYTGTSVSYSGLREVTDKQGNTTLAFIDEATIATSTPFNNPNHDSIVMYNSEGTMLTETGIKSNLENVSSTYEGQPAPTTGSYAVIEGISADFAAELAKVQAQNGTQAVDTTVAPEA